MCWEPFGCIGSKGFVLYYPKGSWYILTLSIYICAKRSIYLYTYTFSLYLGSISLSRLYMPILSGALSGQDKLVWAKYALTNWAAYLGRIYVFLGVIYAYLIWAGFMST
jgi:hypothetical protein